MLDTQPTVQALADIAELVAPGSTVVRRRLAEAVGDHDLGEETAAAEVLLAALYDENGALEQAGMVWCDWGSEPAEIRDDLVQLPSCPGALDWGWVDQFDEDDWDPDDIDSFLRPLAARCRELGVALITLDIEADGYGLGFVPAEHGDRVAELARIARCDLRVVAP
ncbi:hypothetical protein FEK33_26595 [Nocardia asteroides NBRC 15531]|uniref:DUF6630 domain-containing protein n=1 Tax=Nocardia asteroides NBRC 15531 TaxID=1110697 RepID=U5EB28_NOCAS|nr:hypothetical protein [Nocardia asteroides]TLF63573.1 hypothetical protein FEK33_26595 [Nocardia asteroides NBRC 15531]UGT46977.1 hypothetical protein LT345_20915 [Nocardia asteroides]GAD87317.1 hypothetical protein NCAST_34_04470 [Nocardia asteroides NBRC 15531]